MDTMSFGGARLSLARGDITAQKTDAIVNAANSSLMGGGGVDGAIHRNGGPTILEECRRIRATLYPDGMPTGKAVRTTAGNLPARFVIHTVGPVWNGGSNNEPELLASAYRNSLAIAKDANLRTVAFPSISTGAYGYPIKDAARTAIHTVREVLEQNPGAFDEVRFVLFTEIDRERYRQALREEAVA